MQQTQELNAAHDGLAILSDALAEARASDEAAAGPVQALGYSCVPDAEPTGEGQWRAVVRAEGRGETFTVVGRTFETEAAAIAHAATVSLVDLYNGRTV